VVDELSYANVTELRIGENDPFFWLSLSHFLNTVVVLSLLGCLLLCSSTPAAAARLLNQMSNPIKLKTKFEINFTSLN
jgi:hypothetical protein